MSAQFVFSPRAAAGWLARRDPRLLVLASLGFALVTVSLSRPQVLIAAFGFAFILVMGCVRDVRVLARRLAPLEGLMLLMLLTLPFTIPGEPWFRVGPLTASFDGLERALTIALKANSIALALLALLGGGDPAAMGHALARLGIPDKLVHLFLLTVRYVGLLYQEQLRLWRAMRARAFVPRSDRHTWRSLGWLMGMLLVRSLERSRRVTSAMKCRGFHGRFYVLDPLRWQREDSLLALAFLFAFSGLLALEHSA